MEQGIFNLEGIDHESVDATCAAVVRRRWRIERGHEKQELGTFIVKGFASLHREKHALLATDEEENQCVQCLDDMTGRRTAVV